MKKIIDVLMSRGVEPEVDKYLLFHLTLMLLFDLWVKKFHYTFCVNFLTSYCVSRYLFLFLKFVASVIPTIEYDYTMDFDIGSSSR